MLNVKMLEVFNEISELPYMSLDKRITGGLDIKIEAILKGTSC